MLFVEKFLSFLSFAFPFEFLQKPVFSVSDKSVFRSGDLKYFLQDPIKCVCFSHFIIFIFEKAHFANVGAVKTGMAGAESFESGTELQEVFLPCVALTSVDGVRSHLPNKKLLLFRRY